MDAIEVPVDGARRRFPLRTRLERARACQFARHTAWAGGGDVPLSLVDDLIRQYGPGRFGELLRSHDSLRVMNAIELRQLARDGFDIAVHGYYHVGLGTLSPDLVEREVCEARTALAASLPGIKLDAFCLPYGSSSPTALARVREAGFRVCMTTDGGRVSDPWLLPRFNGAQPTAALLRDLARAS
jgi:peptidoglycan/xylan/chitin deacetylase (PgdA/CDA1 family)